MTQRQLKELIDTCDGISTAVLIIGGKQYLLTVNGLDAEAISDDQALIHLNVEYSDEGAERDIQAEMQQVLVDDYDYDYDTADEMSADTCELLKHLTTAGK